MTPAPFRGKRNDPSMVPLIVNAIAAARHEDPEELADVMEVLFGLASYLGVTEGELMGIRDRKRKERGGFEKGIVLKESRYRPPHDL